MPHDSYTLSDWPDGNIETFTLAMNIMAARTGTYVTRLCEAGPIHLLRSSNTPGWCAEVMDANTIVFNSTCTYSIQAYLNYLFAHETGHIYKNRFEILDEFAANTMNLEGTFPTYPGNCGSNNTSSEDFSETIGNWVHVNACDCPGIINIGADWETFWNAYPNHRDWVEGFFGL